MTASPSTTAPAEPAVRSKKHIVESESITHLPFPRFHLFVVTPEGVPVGELRFDPLDSRDGRLADAVLDVDRFTARMTHMGRSELSGLQNTLAALQGRVQEFLARPNTENGNGNGVHADAKPATPPAEPTPPAAPEEALPVPVVATPTLPPLPPRPPRRQRAPSTRRRNAPVPNGTEPAATPDPAAAGHRHAAARIKEAINDPAFVERLTNETERTFDAVAAARQQEAESEIFTQAAQTSAAPTLPTAPAAVAPRTRMGGLVALFGDNETQTTPAPAVSVPLPAPVVTSAPTPATAGASGRSTARPSNPARGTSRGRPASGGRTDEQAPPAPPATPAPTAPTASASAPSTVPATPAPSGGAAAPPAAAPSASPQSPDGVLHGASPPVPPADAQAVLDHKILDAVCHFPQSFGQIRDKVSCTAPELFVALKRLKDQGQLRMEGQLYRLP